MRCFRQTFVAKSNFKWHLTLVRITSKGTLKHYEALVFHIALLIRKEVNRVESPIYRLISRRSRVGTSAGLFATGI